MLRKSDGINNEEFYLRNITQNFPSLINEDSNEILFKEKTHFFYNFSYSDIFSTHRTEQEISTEFGTNADSTWYNHLNIEPPKKKFNAYGNNYTVYELIWNKVRSNFILSGEYYEMEIKLHISDSDNDASKLSNSLFIIINALANIENVEVKFDDLHLGSLVAKIRLYIKDLYAKEETKALLETTKEGVVQAITAGKVSHSGIKEKNANIKKTLKETELLEKELKNKPSDIQAELLNALNLEKFALENEQLKIKIAKERLELIEKLSDLAQKGIVDADSIQIDINGFMYLLKTDNNIDISDYTIDNIT